ncbi:fibronectin type III domain-containing protein, partial [Flavobacterium pedocola]
MKKITFLIFMSLLSFVGYAQFPENFESGIPANWNVMDNGVGTVQNWTTTTLYGPHPSGTSAALIDRGNIGQGNTSEDWLVAPQYSVPAQAQLRFMTKMVLSGDNGTLYQVRVSTTSQTNQASFTTIQQWTESELEIAMANGGSTGYNIYGEIVLNLNAYVGQQIYVAFVRVHTQTGTTTSGDRWLVDNVNLAQQCLDPVTLTATNISATQAQLGWNSPGPATSWEIDYAANPATPDGIPNVTANTNPYMLTGLTPGTQYSYYVRSVCAAGVRSNWVGPFTFLTTPLGQTCAGPIVVGALPYTHTSNTGLYGDVIDGSPGASCGITGNYLNGNDVFYSFTPTFTGVVDISMTPTGNNSGVFVYGSCNDVGILCQAGVANTAGGVRNIPFFAVTAGTTYYIVISTSGTPQTIPYTLTIQQVGCPPPNNLGASGISQTGATLTWGNPASATAWEYVFQPAGTGLPGGAGTPAGTTSATIGGLTANTNYEFYVRVDCGGGTFSAWAGPFQFRTLCTAFPIPFTEGFNSTSTSQACWTVLNLNADANSWNMDYATNPFEGNQSASLVASSVANNDWLISPQIMGLNNNQRLKFRYRVETGTSPCTFEVRLSTNGASPSDMTSVLVAPASYNNTTYIERIVNLAAYSGNVNIGFYVAPGANGSRIYIDQVIIEDMPACPEPTALTVSGVTANSATVNWIPGNTETSWQVLVQTSGLPAPTLPTQGVTVNTTPTYNATPLNSSTTYDVYVLANCGATSSIWIGPVTFRTPQVPAPLPFADTFEGNFDWDTVNGTQTNKWFAGTAANNGGTRSMYISNDNAVTNAYTVTAASVAQSYRDIIIPAGTSQINVAFDWRAIGESTFDYFRVWIVPTTFIPTAGTQITAAADRINISGNINQNGAWTRRNIVVNATAFAGQTVRLVYEWRNDNVVGTQPPAAIDNININVITCPAPTALTVTAVTQTTATLQWTAGASETQWEIVVQAPGSGQPTGASIIIPAGTNPFTVTGLNPSTNYEYYVRAVCSSATDVSTWSGPTVFTTTQIPAIMPYAETFEGTSGWSTVNGTQTNKWFEGTAVNNGGTRAMYVSNDSGVTNTYTLTAASVVQTYRDVQIPAGVNQVNVGFDWRAQGESTFDYLRVWLVPTTFVPTPGTQITAAADRINLSGNINLQATWIRRNLVVNATAFAGLTGRFVFEWRNDGSLGTQPPAAIDNINITVITCPAPTAPIVVSVTQSTATVQWTAGASETQWEVVVQPVGSGQPTGSSTIIPAGTNPFTITGLNPSTNYEYYVRAVCSSATDVSTWTGPRTFTTSQIPAIIPYNEGFEGTSGWTTVNGTAVNKWFEGTAANNGGTRALYISNDSGTTNAYTITSTSIVHAYRDIAIPATCAGTVNVSFDWRSMGQAANDFINVWIVPATYAPTAGTGITAAASGGIFISNQLNGGAAFTNVSYSVNSAPYVGGVMRVIVEWRNNATTGTQPPAAIDNFKVELPTCPKPYNLAVVGSPMPTSANVTWTPGCSETEWEIIVLPTGSPAPTAGTTGTSVTTPPPYTITGLQPYTAYDFYVRAVCTPTSVFSTWAGPKTFTTFIGNDECTGAYNVPVNNNDLCTQVRAAIFNGATVSTVGGSSCGTANSGDIWFQFTATNTSHTIDFRDFSVYNNPIMMTVYSGNCGALTQLACSYNNSTTLSGLQIGSTYFIRASINTVTTNTNVTFNVCVKIPTAPASGTSVDCLINTVNPSFENPVISGTFPRFADLYDHMVLGWRTTAPGHQMEFWPAPNYENHTAHSGNQFIELNATEVSGVYQDFATPVSTVFTYRYAHKGRQGTDTVAVLAGPPGGPYVEIDRRSTGNGPNAWSYPAARAYTVPAGQTVTRFIFQSISSVGGATIGNFLDSIEFKADNSVISVSPLSLDCSSNVSTVVAAGLGTWSAHTDNPGATTIGDPTENTTTISGFTLPGIYRYDWTTLYCTSTIEITYTDNGNRLPLFTQVDPVCELSTIQPLPTTSNEGITGTWSPALDNTTTTTYTFTPNAGQCAIPTTMTITVTPNNTVSAASASPTLCINTAMTAITHTTTEATGIGAAMDLPAGVTASWASNTITISGTPTAAGVFNYSIPLIGDCGTVTATGTITVTNENTVSAASASPTLCINTTMTTITHTTTEATGIGSATGLPAGIMATWAGDTITISGTPTAAGVFNYNIPLTGGCGTASATGTIIVTNDNTVSSASPNTTLCVNSTMTAITHTTTGATGIDIATDLPAGVTATWAGDMITISGTPTVAGVFNYSIPLTGGCGTATAIGTITVNPENTVSAASANPTLCINTAMTAITHTTTDATGIGVATNLPAGVTATWAGNTITISGTPTAAGVFNYSIPLTGGCGTATAIGTITVNPENTVSAASANPTLCINTVMTDITHTTTDATGIGTATGLPTGVTAAWAGNTITISGTPTAAGVFNYSIPLTGGCGTVTATGTITVTTDNTVSAASTNPTLCINTAMTDITHTTTDATGIGAATGLPAGVTATWAGNTITISGTPTAAGVFNYSIPLTGGCGTATAIGTITVNPENTVSAASANPTLCINTAMTAITHTTTDATGIGAATGLPAGVTASWTGNTITISGTPTAAGVFNYSIPLTGGCGTVTATGTITVTIDISTSAASASPTLCVNTAMTAITHTTTGATGIGTATGLPAGVTASWAANTITISGTPTASGVFNYSIPLTGGCGTVIATGTITVNPNVSPTFNQVDPICSGDALATLSTTSNEGIMGTWSPAMDNTTTTTYTFTPNAGQCASTATMTITVNPVVTPTFDAIEPICSGTVLAELPTVSNEGVTGSWSPFLDNTTTTTYTFTPDAGQCAPTATLTIIVNSN